MPSLLQKRQPLSAATSCMNMHMTHAPSLSGDGHVHGAMQTRYMSTGDASSFLYMTHVHTGTWSQALLLCMQAVIEAFTQMNATLLPFVATTPQGQTFMPYSQLTSGQRVHITSAAYNLADQVMGAAAALKAENV